MKGERLVDSICTPLVYTMSPELMGQEYIVIAFSAGFGVHETMIASFGGFSSGCILWAVFSFLHVLFLHQTRLSCNYLSSEPLYSFLLLTYIDWGSINVAFFRGLGNIETNPSHEIVSNEMDIRVLLEKLRVIVLSGNGIGNCYSFLTRTLESEKRKSETGEEGKGLTTVNMRCDELGSTHTCLESACRLANRIGRWYLVEMRN